MPPFEFPVKVVLGTLLLFTTTSTLTEGAKTYQCQHKPPLVSQLKYAAVANTASGPHRGKRQTGSEFRPIRIVPFYDSTVEALPQDQQMQVKIDAIQYVISTFERILTVRPLQGKILFQRECNGSSTPFLNPGGFCPRTMGCAGSSECGGFIKLPEEHLAACKVCDDDGTNCETIGQDGAGVENADFVLYVTADLSFPQCSVAALAFAVPCQLERQFDRPIVGFTNICVNRAFDEGIEQLRSILTHEITHALVFNQVLFAFYRDENGNPRTARDPNTGLPMNYDRQEQTFVPDETTVAKKTVRRTTFPNGTFTYEVQQFVTPALMREGRSFFGCDSFSGVPLEDVPFDGTRGNHFEQRVLNNELMTGSVSAANAPISRFTLSLYEDSGWYKPIYEEAEPLRWGMNQGCGFGDEGCLYPQTKTLRPPFCEDTTQLVFRSVAIQNGNGALFREIGANSSCHYDRGSVGVCNAYNKTTPFDPNFQYFMYPEFGGADQIADFCPYVDGYISCKRQRNALLTINTYAETHGPNSKCVDIRIDGNWIYNNSAMSPMTGGACYEVYCDEVQGPIVSVMGTNSTCTSGKEIYISQVDLPNVANVITIVCPPCEDLCWDNLKACASPTTAPGPSAAAPVGSDEARTAATVLFCLMAIMLVVAIAAGVIAGVLFWKWRNEQKKAGFDPQLMKDKTDYEVET